MVGEIVKSAPLVVLPMGVPPEETSYQLIVFPEEIALIFDEDPIQIAEGLAVTTEGAVGSPTPIVIGILPML